MLWCLLFVNYQLLNLGCYFILIVCDKDFDLVFVIDGSGSIRQVGVGNFNLMKIFMKMLIEGFSVDLNRIYVVVVIYFLLVYVKVLFGLNIYYSYEDVFRGIDDILYFFGGIYIGKVIMVVKNRIYMLRQDRDDVFNVCIIMIDGKLYDDFKGLLQVLFNIGIIIFVIGIGKYYDINELDEMVGNLRYVYIVDFKDLINFV